MKEHSYMAFLQEAKQFIPQERIYTDELRRLAWGTDAGFYRPSGRDQFVGPSH